jgi:hypothetical protein
MHRPDTIIEIHRERVQDQTVGMFSGDKYTQSVDGTGYSATATLDLTLHRVWFILDSHGRLWREETDGEARDPLRHFAIDLVIFDSKIVIDSVTCIPLIRFDPRLRPPNLPSKISNVSLWGLGYAYPAAQNRQPAERLEEFMRRSAS